MKAIIITTFLCISMFAAAHAQQINPLKNAPDTTIIKKIADGSSFANAIVIKEKSEATGGAAEYAWLRKNYPGYHTKMQSLVYHDKKPFDILHVVLANGTEKDFYFDIGNFFGKF